MEGGTVGVNVHREVVIVLVLLVGEHPKVVPPPTPVCLPNMWVSSSKASTAELELVIHLGEKPVAVDHLGVEGALHRGVLHLTKLAEVERLAEALGGDLQPGLRVGPRPLSAQFAGRCPLPQSSSA